MMGKSSREQVMPLTPARYQNRSSDHENEAGALPINNQSKLFPSHRRRRCLLQCCGCVSALFLVAIVMIIVMATLFHVRNPRIRMNSVTLITRPDPAAGLLNNNGSSGGDDRQNVTLLADVSMKNPNYNSFRYSNSTATLYYGGMVVGEGHIPQGLAKARRTVRFNITVDMIPDKILGVPSLRSDFNSGSLKLTSYTIISGKVKVLNVVEKSVTVKMNCTITYNISSQSVQEMCRRQG